MDFYSMKRKLMTMVSEKVRARLGKALSENPQATRISMRDVFYEIRNEIPMDRAIVSEMKSIGERSELFQFDTEEFAFIRVDAAGNTVKEDDHENKPQSV